MKTLISTTLALLTVSTLAAADNRKPDRPDPNAAAAATTKDIEKALGFVPDFVRALPRELLPSFWAGIGAIEMNPNTALDGKTKELIGLAVAAQIPCEFCIYFHTEFARVNGATEQEIEEAVGMAAMTREGSTLLHGLSVDPVQFKKDVSRIATAARKK